MASLVHCPCGHSFELSADPAETKQYCPQCGLDACAASTEAPAAAPAPATPASDLPPPSAPSPAGTGRDAGIETVLIEKGWATREQIQAAVKTVAQSVASGKHLRLGEALVQAGVLTGEQVRQALAVQGKSVMQCPGCKKSFNIRTLKPGTRAICKVCRVPLVLPVSITDLHADDSTADVSSVPIGQAVDPKLVDLLPGYRIERLLGAGGMGTVYLARQKVLDRWVAIKILTPELAKNPTYVQRFLVEARAAAKLLHENIVGAIDAGEADGRPYFVMEYVEGETLLDLLRREQGIPERRALEIARHGAMGLRHAHKNGLIHRDVKPANIIIATDGKAKICDFGLAREINSDVRLTQAGSVFSSPAYASPEQARAERDLDHRADMYSLGITLFEMLTGKLPFQGDASSALLVKHVTETPPPPRSLNPKISIQTNALVVRLLKKPREARYRDYDELIQVLDQILAVPAEPARAAAAPVARPQLSRPPAPPPAAEKKPPMLWIAGGAAALLIIIVAIVAFRGSGTSGPGAKVEAQLQEARKLQERARADVSLYPEARARWKDLEARFHGTPHHSLFASPYLEFEALVSKEAEKEGARLLAEADRLVSEKEIVDAILVLRSFPAGLKETAAAAQVQARTAELQRTLEERFAAEREAVYTLVALEKFDEARRQLPVVQKALTASARRGGGLIEPRYAQELSTLAGLVDEKHIFAQKRKAEAAAAKVSVNEPPKDPVTKAPENPVPPPPRPVVKTPEKTPPAPVTKKPAPPGLEARKEAEKMIRELFKDDYAKRSVPERQALARRLLELAKQTNDDPAAKFVLYWEAQDIASLAGDSEMALKAIDALAAAYEVRVPPLKLGALLGAAQAARTPTDLRSSVQDLLDLADAAIADEDAGLAEKAASGAAAAARRGKDIALASRSDAKVREVTALKGEFEMVKKAKETLTARPDDAPAAFVVGRHACLVRGRWEEGLPFLAKGSDPGFKAAASKDLTNPTETNEVISTGDAWWDLAEKQTGKGQEELRVRASRWYEIALPQATGLIRTKLEKRISAAAGGSGATGTREESKIVDLLALIDPARDGVMGGWQISGGALISPVDTAFARLQVPYCPPDEYDLEVAIDRKEGTNCFETGHLLEGTRFTVGLDSWSGSISGINLIDGKTGNVNESVHRAKVFQDVGKAYTLVYSIRKNRVSVVVDGNRIIDWKADVARLSFSSYWAVPEPSTLIIGSYQTKFRISKLRLTTVSGQGRILR